MKKSYLLNIFSIVTTTTVSSQEFISRIPFNVYGTHLSQDCYSTLY